MRIFVAIKISPALQSEIVKWKKRWSNLPVRWLKEKNLHLTIWPPWGEPEETLETVKTKMKTLAGRIGPFIAVFEKINYGPTPSQPHLIWAAGKTPSQLIILKNEVGRVLERSPENRPFKMHLTLARFQSDDFSCFAIKRLDENIFWQDRLESFVLMRSRLLRGGAEYDVLEEIRL